LASLIGVAGSGNSVISTPSVPASNAPQAQNETPISGNVRKMNSLSLQQLNKETKRLRYQSNEDDAGKEYYQFKIEQSGLKLKLDQEKFDEDKAIKGREINIMEAKERREVALHEMQMQQLSLEAEAKKEENRRSKMKWWVEAVKLGIYANLDEAKEADPL